MHCGLRCLGNVELKRGNLAFLKLRVSLSTDLTQMVLWMLRLTPESKESLTVLFPRDPNTRTESRRFYGEFLLGLVLGLSSCF